MLQSAKFYYKDIPDNKTILDHIYEETDYEIRKKLIKPQFEPDLFVRKKFDAEALTSEMFSLFREVPPVIWRSQDTISLYGLSLTYNPHQSKSMWKKGSFGHPRYKIFNKKDYYEAVSSDEVNRIKDDYLDSLGFYKLLPQLEKYPALYSFLTSFKRPIVRVTARVINCATVGLSEYSDGGFHTDDSPFDVLRVNFNLNCSGDVFGLQYHDKDGDIHYFNAGENRVVNTDTKHRPYFKSPSYLQRVSLIVGVLCWLDFDPKEECWSLSEHYGTKHPYDLVKQGLI